MPFTLAHPAFAIPLRRAGLPVSALAIGAMVPDLPLYAGALVTALPVRESYAHTHGPVGLLTTDLAAGMALWGLWMGLLRPAAYAGLPAPLRRKVHALSAPAQWSAATVGRAVLAVGLGAATHVVLDEFTHAGRWASRHLPWFAERHAGVLGTSWIQHGAGLLGIAVLAFLIVRVLCRPGEADGVLAERHGAPALRPRLAALTWLAPAAVLAAAGLLGLAALAGGDPVAATAYTAVTRGIALAGVSAIAAAGAWRLSG